MNARYLAIAASNRTDRRAPFTTWLFALAVAVALASPKAARADLGPVIPPPVPDNIEVPAMNRPFLVGHAVGTQNYVCLPSTSGVAWTLFTPQATLFTEQGRQIQTHFFSPNPWESGTVRAAWQDSKDTSIIWGRAIASSTDPSFVEPGAIPWLLVEVVGAQAGPTGGGKLAETTYVQRLNTVGGVAPDEGCAQTTDVGRRAYVPYTTEYYFFKAKRARNHR